ncbi:MAG: hypothetical protein FJ125_17645, partial [Deltaproteobacteria bacterium]|nr:hypothetical protein [Deltaproteobacteria bacterium]
MSAATLLLRRLLEQAGGPLESGFILVLDGEGLQDLPATLETARGAYAVRRPTTEIGLRHELWKAAGAPLIAVVSEELARRLPPDLVRRSQKQRVHALGVNEVLTVILGVRVVGAEEGYLQELALQNVEQLGHQLSHRTLPSEVGRKLLTELLVDVTVGDQVRSQPPAKILADWARTTPTWPDNLLRLVGEVLPTLHGDEGRLLAWVLQKEIGERIKTLLVYGALLTVEAHEVPQHAWGPLWKAVGHPPLEMDREVLRRTICHLVEGSLEHLGAQAAPWL